MALKDAEAALTAAINQLDADIGTATTNLSGEVTTANNALTSGDLDTFLTDLQKAVADGQSLQTQENNVITALANALSTIQQADAAVTAIGTGTPPPATARASSAAIASQLKAMAVKRA